MIPIVFCASFVPCVSATKPPETSCPRRKSRLTFAGDRRLISQTMPVIRANATAMPANGAIRDGFSTFCQRPAHCTTSQPWAMIAEPMIPPISAWLELDGKPRYQVTRFQVIAPTRPARRMFSVIASGSTIPLATVAATLKEMKAPAKFSTAAMATARRGESARVDTLVAIEFAVSWKPFVKSKNNATATTATSVTVTRERLTRS